MGDPCRVAEGIERMKGKGDRFEGIRGRRGLGYGPTLELIRSRAPSKSSCLHFTKRLLSVSLSTASLALCPFANRKACRPASFTLVHGSLPTCSSHTRPRQPYGSLGTRSPPRYSPKTSTCLILISFNGLPSLSKKASLILSSVSNPSITCPKTACFPSK